MSEVYSTELLAKDIADILNQYPMCDVVIDKNELLILDHTGAYILKKITFKEI